MTGAAPSPAVTIWDGEPVPLAKVDATLAKQYRDYRTAQGGAGLVRTRVATLVVASDDPGRLHRALDVVAQLHGRNPSRCVGLLLRPPPPDGDDGRGVRTWARLAHRAGGRSRRVYDEVVVEATVPDDSVAAIVLPLLLPEIPVFLWWPGQPPFGSRAVAELLAVADRLIVDSLAFDDPVDGLRSLGEIWSSEGQPPVSDCAWGRLTPWRELLAAAFDGLPLRDGLDRVTRVRLVTSAHPTGALLLAGWLASRLGWSPETPPADGHATYRTRTGQVVVEVRHGAGRSALASVRVEVDTPAGAAAVTVGKGPGDHLLATTEVAGEPAQHRIGQHRDAGQANALGAELEVFGRDRVYEEALAAALPWAEALP